MSRVAAVAVMLAVAASPVLAQDANDPLRKEVAELKEKVRALEQAQAPAKDEPVAEMKLGSEGAGIFDTLFRETKVNGFVDVGYVFNLDRPGNGLNGNTGDSAVSATVPAVPLVPALDGASVRAFDKKSRSFYLHNAQLELMRAADEKLPVGYNVQLSFGSDANVFATADSNTTDFFDVQEANVSYMPSQVKGATITVGKFATFAGMEVIESGSNNNYSRSLPFLFAIPFTHTGARANYKVNDNFDFTVGVNNGWDITVDNNDAKTGEFQFHVVQGDKTVFNAWANIYYGAEKARTFAADPANNGNNERGDKRMLVDLVATLALENGWTFGANVDFGSEDEVVTDPVTGTLEDADWSGFAVYAKYKVNDTFSPSIRFSRLNDADGYRTTSTNVVAPAVSTPMDKTISEFTLTGEFALAEKTVFRVELRHDFSDEDIFLDGNREDDSQTTLGAELIISF